jgi:putative Mg2+ transporter-C (MgtC) family protein
MDLISNPGSLADLAARLTLSAVLGGVIGFNRELHNKPAGLRTHALVAVGGCLLTLVGLALATQPAIGDAGSVSRIIQGVVAGIGFVGGGVILRDPASKDVYGLTTAASILVVATLGCATGLGLWRAAVASAVLALLILVIGGLMDRFIHKNLNGEQDD